MSREHHYCPDTGESQYWQFSHATGWSQIDKYTAWDWPIETYRYLSWSNAIPEARKGIPPRVWI